MVPVDFLRSLSNQFLPDSCSISRLTETPSGDGTSSSWSTVATVACRVSPIGSGQNENLGADQSMQAVAQWAVWVPALTDVTVRDRLVVGSRTFEVTRVGARSYEAIRECLCLEVS